VEREAVARSVLSGYRLNGHRRLKLICAREHEGVHETVEIVEDMYNLVLISLCDGQVAGKKERKKRKKERKRRTRGNAAARMLARVVAVANTLLPSLS